MSKMILPPPLFAALASALRGSAGSSPIQNHESPSVFGKLAVELSISASSAEGLRVPAQLKACSNQGAHFDCGRSMSVEDQFVAFVPIRGASIPILCRVVRSSLVSPNLWLIESAFVSLLQSAVPADAREKEMERIRRSILG